MLSSDSLTQNLREDAAWWVLWDPSKGGRIMDLSSREQQPKKYSIKDSEVGHSTSKGGRIEEGGQTCIIDKAECFRLHPVEEACDRAVLHARTYDLYKIIKGGQLRERNYETWREHPIIWKQTSPCLRCGSSKTS